MQPRPGKETVDLASADLIRAAPSPVSLIERVYLPSPRF